MKIVAEGVEIKEQVDFLASENCDMIQGYYYAKPMPVKEFEELVARDA
jgi:EAL domain-containing protein (putative c-di-GMP-specific phosphodiesterase class I)